MKLADLKKKTPKELVLTLNEFKEELFKLRLQNKVGQLEKTHRLKELRKGIARALTLINKQSGAL